MGLREDFQVYPQPKGNPALPLTGQYPNQFSRFAPRFGFAWQPLPKTVVESSVVAPRQFLCCSRACSPQEVRAELATQAPEGRVINCRARQADRAEPFRPVHVRVRSEDEDCHEKRPTTRSCNGSALSIHSWAQWCVRREASRQIQTLDLIRRGTSHRAA